MEKRTVIEEGSKEKSLALAYIIFELLTKDVYDTVNGIPPTKRRATIILKGLPGTEKSLISEVLTRNQKVGIVTQSQDKFCFENCYNGGDARGFTIVDNERVNYFKQVFEGRGYLILKKGANGKVQSLWTPVIITTNQANLFTEVTANVDRDALLQRTYVVEVTKENLRKWSVYDEICYGLVLIACTVSYDTS